MTPPKTERPASLRELCAKATPGPWRPQGQFVGAESHTVCDCWASTIASATQVVANRDLIARFPPETARAVYEALQAAVERAGQHRTTAYYENGGTLPCPDEPLQAQLFHALSLLDGTAKTEGQP